MTSDAKIGLLLGLVFIFIIAFVINGLPRFRSAVNNSELTNSIVNPRDDSLGIADRERKVQETFDWQERIEAEPAQDFPPVVQNRSGTGGPAEESESVTVVAYDNENPDGVRYIMPLTPNASVMEENTVQEPAYIERLGPVRSNERTQVRRQEPVKQAKPKTYIVQDGDRLSDIAKKFYGEVEGNRLVNINRIFEANRRLLKSADEIFLGQKLTIPPILVSTQPKDNSSGIFSNQLFERVKSIGSRTETGRWYVVKDGDNLWNIATEQLGKGSRYTEISKLNANILADEDRVDPGMRLRLPAR